MSHLWFSFRILLWNNLFSKIRFFPKLPSPLVAAVAKNATSSHPLVNIGVTRPVSSSAQVLDSTSHCYCPTSATLQGHNMGSVSHIPPPSPVKDHDDEEQLNVGASQQEMCAPPSPLPCGQGIPPPPPPPPLPASSTPSTEGIPSCPPRSGNPLVDSDFTARLLAGKQKLKKVGASDQKTDVPTFVLPTEEDIPLPEDSTIQHGSVMEVASGTVVGKGEQKTRKGRKGCKKAKSTKESFASELTKVLKSGKRSRKHKA